MRLDHLHLACKCQAFITSAWTETQMCTQADNLTDAARTQQRQEDACGVVLPWSALVHGLLCTVCCFVQIV